MEILDVTCSKVHFMILMLTIKRCLTMPFTIFLQKSAIIKSILGSMIGTSLMVEIGTGRRKRKELGKNINGLLCTICLLAFLIIVRCLTV